jgi:hypothetical protein
MMKNKFYQRGLAGKMIISIMIMFSTIFVLIFSYNLKITSEIKEFVAMMVSDNKEILIGCLAFEPFSSNPQDKYYAYYCCWKSDSLAFMKLCNDHSMGTLQSDDNTLLSIYFNGRA